MASSEGNSLIKRIGWHATFASSIAVGLWALKSRLSSSWDERKRDMSSQDSIWRHFELSWTETADIRHSLLQDLRKKADNLFLINELMEELETLQSDGNADLPPDQLRQKKIEIWEKLKIETYVYLGMTLVGKSLYIRSVLRDCDRVVTAEDVSAANRLLMCLGSRFIQNGLFLLAQSIRNAAGAVLSKISLAEPVGLPLLRSLIDQIRHEIDSKAIVEESLFGSLDELIGSDLNSHRRRIFIGLLTELRVSMKSDYMQGLFKDQLEADFNACYVDLFGASAVVDLPSETIKITEIPSQPTTQPLIVLLPLFWKTPLAKYRPAVFSTPFERELQTVSAAIFTQSSIDISRLFLNSSKYL